MLSGGTVPSPRSGTMRHVERLLLHWYFSVVAANFLSFRTWFGCFPA